MNKNASAGLMVGGGAACAVFKTRRSSRRRRAEMIIFRYENFGIRTVD